MISIGLDGRLGNHMFQYALCRVVAEKNGFDYCIPNQKPNKGNSVKNGWLGQNIFDCSLGLPYHRQKGLFVEKKQTYSSSVFDVGDGTHLEGWWQSEKYFEGWEDEIREWFRLDKPNSEYINEDYCVIHYRAQDGYLRERYTPKDEFFIKAKKQILDFKNTIKFVIITDNVPLAKQKFKGDIVISNDIKTDFTTIQYSKYKIISNSSFSWWAAWLGSNESEMIIAPDRWMNHNHNKSKDNLFYPYDIKSKYFKYI
tara:strand:+ start:3846 stop:4610 length:765 start_codon:yes stop_codon:yes gene_type:complete